MTPRQILDSALARIPILLVKSEEQQERLLRDSLQYYARHAGVIQEIEVHESITQRPRDFLAVASITDENGAYCGHRIVGDEIRIKLTQFDKGPFRIIYFVDLTNTGLDQDLPDEIEFGLVADHLESRIGEINAQKFQLTRAVQLDVEQKTSSEYQQNRERIEEQILAKAAIPDIAIF